MDNEDLIREQMQETRTSLTEKLEALEDQVSNKVQEATSNVAETVEAVKETVQDTVATVKDAFHDTAATVKESVEDGVVAFKGFFDVSAHVEQHPWVALGGAAVAGYCLARYLESKSPAPMAAMSPVEVPSPVPPNMRQTNGRHGNGRHKRADSKPSMAEGFMTTLAPEISKLKGLALGALLGVAREMIVKSASESLQAPLAELIDDVTQKVGGTPMPSAARNPEFALHTEGPKSAKF